MAEIFRQALFAELFGRPRGFGFLVVVIVHHRDRMVDVVDLRDEVGDRQLELVEPQPVRHARRCEAMAFAEIHQDVGDLRDYQTVELQIGRRERGAAGAVVQIGH